MAESRIAIACAFRGYIRMYAISTYGLDEIAPKDILREHSPIKSLTACDTTGIFASLNSVNEIMVGHISPRAETIRTNYAISIF